MYKEEKFFIMYEIVLIRHGESAWNKENRFTGWTDVPLSEKNVNFGQYSSASTEQKREILKQRSHEHFEKKVKERKDYLMNKAIGEMKSLGKKE